MGIHVRHDSKKLPRLSRRKEAVDVEDTNEAGALVLTPNSNKRKTCISTLVGHMIWAIDRSSHLLFLNLPHR